MMTVFGRLAVTARQSLTKSKGSSLQQSGLLRRSSWIAAPNVETLRQCRGEVKRFDGYLISAEQRRLRRAPRLQFDQVQIQTLREMAPMDLVARSPVVADKIAHVASVQCLQHFDEFIEQDRLQVARVTITANSLVGRVHAN